MFFNWHKVMDPKLNEYKTTYLNTQGSRQVLRSNPTDLEVLLRAVPQNDYPLLVQALSLPELKKDINTPDPSASGMTPLLKSLNIDKTIAIELLNQGADPLVTVGGNDIVSFLRMSPLPNADKIEIRDAIVRTIQARKAQLESERKSVEEVSEAKNLSSEIEKKIKKFLGGRKSRKRKSKRKSTKRRKNVF